MPSRLLPISLVLAAVALAACPRPTEGPVTPPQSESGGAVVPDGAVDPGPAPDDSADDSPVQADGSCLSDADCNGGVCEGEGCGDDQPGKCAPVDRMCTRDAQLYCGCDGEAFRASGSCPGRRFDHRGEC